MVRLSLKNTFISFTFDEAEEGEEAEDAHACSPRLPQGACLRSYSAESVSPVKRGVASRRASSPAIADPQERQIEKLNGLLRARGAASPASFFPEGDSSPLRRRRPQPAEKSEERRQLWGDLPLDEDEEEIEARSESSTGPAEACPVKLRRALSSNSVSTSEGGSVSTAASAAFQRRDAEHPPEEETPEERAGRLAKGYQHKRVPKKLDLKEEYGSAADYGLPTTLMLRNIPNRLTQADLIAELEVLGFEGSFDFLYAPTEEGGRHRHRGVRKADSNVGYCFVNFVHPAWAERCLAVFQKHQFAGSARVTVVSVAHVQGLRANLAHYEKAAVNSSRARQQRRPVVVATIAPTLDLQRPAPR